MNGFPEETLCLPQEQQAIGDKCYHPAGRFIEFKLEEIEQSAAERFEQQARQFPDRTAIKTKTHHLTYDQLNRSANRVARAILDRRGFGEEPIALLIERSLTKKVEADPHLVAELKLLALLWHQSTTRMLWSFPSIVACLKLTLNSP